jgi:hypothetical protein
MRMLAFGGLVLFTLAGCTINTGKGDGDPDPSGTDPGTGTSGGSTGSRDTSGGGAAAGGRAGAATGDGAASGQPSGAGGGPDTDDVTPSPFTASNLPPTAKLGGAGDLVLTGECVIDGKLGTITCRGGEAPDGYDYELLKQSDPDATNMAVFSVRSLTIESGSNVMIVGPYAVGFVASQTISINGGLIATVDGNDTTHANGGGFAGASNSVGLGPGAGEPPGAQIGAGGGAFCGKGGSGGAVSGTASNGGTPYGNKTLIPLVGGSSGGAPDFGNSGGGGGGIQLTAGVSLNIGIAGSVAAPGGGGGGVVGGGGGSGGAVLLEAPSVRIAGSVSANGGGGGIYDASGQRGRVDGKPAKGGSGANPGGDGSSTDSVDGAAGSLVSEGSKPGAGGGGAGYVRINTADGKADISGTVSPSLDTACSSVGKLAPK